MEYASKGVAGTGLGLGIAGTALGALDMLDDVGETMTKEELTAHDEAHNSLNGGV